ncbi:MAG: cyclic nucleotide-binding domain-containing protein [Candidatus Altimarinota bacterium]
MKEVRKNVDINSESLIGLREKEANHKLDMKHLQTDVVRQNSLLHYCDIFEKSPLFEKKVIQKGSLLFDEGSQDNNLYIIKKGLLSVEKYTSQDKVETKQLAVLKSGDFLGEASLSKNSGKKEALIKALETSEILQIDGANDVKKFIEENPSVGYDFLKHIILETNERLLEANKLITSHYEIEKAINSMKEITPRNIFGLIDRIRSIVDVDYILYFEKHQIMENFLTLKYDSRQPNKMQDKIFERSGYFLNLDELFEECNINGEDKIVINKISIGNEIFGYLIFGREKRAFNGSDKKTFSSLSNSLAGVIKKLFTDKENRNKIYVEEMKK